MIIRPHAIAALAAGGDDLMEDIPEAQLLACRCMANLIEAIPGSAHTIVYHGAIPVLCSKLIMITDIDLAEQTLSVRNNTCCHHLQSS